VSAEPRSLHLTEHPRAQRQIRRAKGLGGLGAFALTAWLAHGAGLPFDAMLERAIIAAIAGYVLLWTVAVLVWRQLAQAELESARRQILEHVHALQAEQDGGADMAARS
jgi:hypothetical protein